MALKNPRSQKDFNFSVSSTHPSNGCSKVPIDTRVFVDFTKEVDKTTVLKNVILVKDIDRTLNDITDLAKANVKVIKVTINVNDNSILFIPDELLEYDSKYVVIIRSNLKSVDIYPETLKRDHLFYFITDDGLIDGVKPDELELPPTIVEPMDLSITNEFNRIAWECPQSTDITIQLSTDNNFNEIVFEEVVSGASEFLFDRYFDDGKYYIRVQSEKSAWSPICHIFLQNIEEVQITEEDRYLDDINDLLSQVEEKTFSHSLKQINKVHPKTKFLLVEMDGKIALEDLSDIEVFKSLSVDNEEDELHDNLEILSYAIQYNKETDKTYLSIELNKAGL